MIHHRETDTVRATAAFPPDDSFFPRFRLRVMSEVGATPNGRFASTATLVKCAALAAGTLGSYIMLLSAGHSAIRALLWAAVYGSCALLLGFNAGHDASHYCLVRSRRLNRVIQRIVFSLIGVDSYLWRFRHTKSHHIMPNVNGSDIDIDENPFFRLSPNQPHRPYFRYQHFYAPFVYPLVLLHTVFWQDFVYLRKKELANLENISFPRSVAAACVATKIIHLTVSMVIPWYLLPYSAVQIIAGYLGISFIVSSAFTFSLIGTHFSDYVDFPVPGADGCLPTGWAEHALRTSCDWSPTSRVANAIMGGLNAHAVHHLFPAIAHSHNARIARELIRLNGRGEVDYRWVTLPQMIAGHFRFLKRLGRGNGGCDADQRPAGGGNGSPL